LQLPQRLSFFGEPQKLTCRRTSTSILIDAIRRSELAATLMENQKDHAEGDQQQHPGNKWEL
jgi:hypothetical protein